MTGFVLSIIIGVLSMGLSSIHPGLESLVISAIMGMIIGNLFENRTSLQSGLNICIRYFLPAAIILYGTQLTVRFSEPYHLIIVPAIFIATFLLTLLFSRLFRINRNFSILLATGLSVCGASAITVISPLIGSKREETSLSIISIMVIGLLGMMVYPLFIAGSGLMKEGFALLAGTTLPMLGQVKVVAGMADGEVLQEAVNYKLLRVSLLILLILWFGVIKREGGNKDEAGPSFPYPIRLILVSGFLLMVLLSNLTFTQDLQKLFEPLSRFLLSVTLAAIGLSVDFDSIAEIGPRPLYAVLFSWIISIAIVYLIVNYV